MLTEGVETSVTAGLLCDCVSDKPLEEAEATELMISKALAVMVETTVVVGGAVGVVLSAAAVAALDCAEEAEAVAALPASS